MSDTEASDLLSGEPLTLYQLIRRYKHNPTSLVRNIRDGEGNIQTSPLDIATNFIAFFQKKYANVAADPVSVQTLATQIRTEATEDMGLHCESPLTQAEILYAITS
jgi:hypothetical protein